MADKKPHYVHPVFGTIKPSMRRSLAAKHAHKEFRASGEYHSRTGLFAHYHFLRCLEDNIPVSIEMKLFDSGQQLYTVKLVR